MISPAGASDENPGGVTISSLDNAALAAEIQHLFAEESQ